MSLEKNEFGSTDRSAAFDGEKCYFWHFYSVTFHEPPVSRKYRWNRRQDLPRNLEIRIFQYSADKSSSSSLSLSGCGREQLQSSDDWTTGLAIIFTRNRIYWADVAFSSFCTDGLSRAFYILRHPETAALSMSPRTRTTGDAPVPKNRSTILILLSTRLDKLLCISCENDFCVSTRSTNFNIIPTPTGRNTKSRQMSRWSRLKRADNRI